MAKKLVGVCKDCIIYAMCTDMCDDANKYVNDTTIRHTKLDDWTWTVILRESGNRFFFI